MESKCRNTNMDILRSFAIIGVVALHIIGGAITLRISSGNRLVFDFLLAISYTSVNIFGLISGYLKIDKPHYSVSIIRILMNTLFWCLVITTICAVLKKIKSVGSILKCLFPLLDGRLWYINCYFFVFWCIPFVNILVNKLSKSKYVRLLIILTILLSIVPTLFFRDYYNVVNYGYSAGWLLYLYLFGGYFKRFGVLWGKESNWKAIIVLLLSVFIIVVSKYILIIIQNDLQIDTDVSWCLYYYNSPLTLLNSICIFEILSNIKINENMFGKIFSWISKVSLGIYIIHAHPFILDYVLCGDNLDWAVEDNPFVTLLLFLILILVVCFCLGIFEWIRIKMFKICNIDLWFQKLGNTIDGLLKLNSCD